MGQEIADSGIAWGVRPDGPAAHPVDRRGPPGWLGRAIEREGHPRLGDDAGTLGGLTPPASSSAAQRLGGQVDVMIDFSRPQRTGSARYCQDRMIPLVVGTTGFSHAQRIELEKPRRRSRCWSRRT